MGAILAHLPLLTPSSMSAIAPPPPKYWASYALDALTRNTLISAYLTTLRKPRTYDAVPVFLHLHKVTLEHFSCQQEHRPVLWPPLSTAFKGEGNALFMKRYTARRPFQIVCAVTQVFPKKGVSASRHSRIGSSALALIAIVVYLLRPRTSLLSIKSRRCLV